MRETTNICPLPASSRPHVNAPADVNCSSHWMNQRSSVSSAASRSRNHAEGCCWSSHTRTDSTAVASSRDHTCRGRWGVRAQSRLWCDAPEHVAAVTLSLPLPSLNTQGPRRHRESRFASSTTHVESVAGGGVKGTYVVGRHDPAQAHGEALPHAHHADKGCVVRHHLHAGRRPLHASPSAKTAGAEQGACTECKDSGN